MTLALEAFALFPDSCAISPCENDGESQRVDEPLTHRS